MRAPSHLHCLRSIRGPIQIQRRIYRSWPQSLRDIWTEKEIRSQWVLFAINMHIVRALCSQGLWGSHPSCNRLLMWWTSPREREQGWSEFRSASTQMKKLRFSQFVWEFLLQSQEEN